MYIDRFSPAAPPLPATEYKLIKDPSPLEFSTALHSTSLPTLVTPDAFLPKSVSGAGVVGSETLSYSPVALLSPHDISSGASSLTNVTPLKHHASSVSSISPSETLSSASLPAHPLMEAMGGAKDTESEKQEPGDGFDPSLLMLPPSSSGSLSDLTVSPEKSLLVTADQESPTLEKDASSLIVAPLMKCSSSESASDGGQDVLVMTAPTKVSSLDEGPTAFPFALPDPVNIGDADSTSRTGSQTTTSFSLEQEPPVSETLNWPQLGQQYAPSSTTQESEDQEEETEDQEKLGLSDTNVTKSQESQAVSSNELEAAPPQIELKEKEENAEEEEGVQEKVEEKEEEEEEEEKDEEKKEEEEEEEEEEERKDKKEEEDEEEKLVNAGSPSTELDRNGDSTSHQGDIEGKQVEK